jgi:uncharacterized protein (TIGR02246 family)
MTAPDPTFLRDYSTRWIAAWNSHDTDQILDLLHPDVVWDERVFWPEVLHGRDAVRAYVDAIWKAMPEVQFEEIQLFTAAADGRALVLWRQRGLAPPQLATEATFEATGCDIFLGFTDGLLSHYTAAYEIVDMLRQLGALPPRAGKTGGAYLLSLAGRR